MRPWLLGLTAAALVAPAARVPAADAPADVIKKAIDAHGGAAALDKYRAGECNVTGKMTLPGGIDADFTGAVVYQLPDKYRMNLDLDLGGAKIALVQTASGKTARTTVNGAPQKMSAGQKAEALQAAAIQDISQFTPLLAPGTKYKLAAAPAADVAGKPTDAVLVSGPGIKDVTLYFDKASHLLVKTARKGLSPDEKEVLEESVFKEYSAVSGVKMPMAMAVTHDGKPFMTMTVSGAKMLEKADPKSFSTED